VVSNQQAARRSADDGDAAAAAVERVTAAAFDPVPHDDHGRVAALRESTQRHQRLANCWSMVAMGVMNAITGSTTMSLARICLAAPSMAVKSFGMVKKSGSTAMRLISAPAA